MKKKETIAKMKDKVEKQLGVSDIFQEVSEVVRKSIVNMHQDWEISLFLSCDSTPLASISSLPSSLSPSLSKFYSLGGWEEREEAGDAWCGCGFEGAIGCQSCEVLVDLGQVSVFIIYF